MHGRHGRVPSGVHFVHPAKKMQGIEAGGATDLAARRQRGQQAGDKSVNMEERHDVEGAIRVGERQGRADIARRGAHIALGQRHDLGTRGGARGVQHQRHVVRSGRFVLGRGKGSASPSQFERSRTALGCGCEIGDSDAHALRNLDGGCGLASFDDE